VVVLAFILLVDLFYDFAAAAAHRSVAPVRGQEVAQDTVHGLTPC
jgi:hypothetical protein